MTDVTKNPYDGMPTKLRIGCYTFKVQIGTRQEHSHAFGWLSTEEQILSLSEHQRSQKLANTFLHEVIHAIHWHFGILYNIEGNGEESTLPSEEAFTTLTANGLCAFWQDNPEAMEWFQGLVHSEN